MSFLTTRGSLRRAIELLGDQPSVPSEDRLGPHETHDLREGRAAEPLADLGQGVRRSPSLSFTRPGVCALRMRFSATRYSFLRRELLIDGASDVGQHGLPVHRRS